MKHESFNESAEMYLKTVVELADDANPVSISAIAGRLGVTAVSATEMVRRLEAQSLLEHQPYKGVILTETGRQEALLLLRNHRLWECFLVEKLNIPWQAAHESACRLEHATDTAVIDALAEFLQQPQTCPHGNPIPSATGMMIDPEDVPLLQLEPGQRGIVQRIAPESETLLTYLAGLNLKPGTAVVIESIAPFQGPLTLRSGENTIVLGQEAAHYIFIEPISSESVI